MLYTELQSAVHAMIQRLEYSFTFNPSLLTIPKRKQQVAEILEEAEKYIWRIHKIVPYFEYTLQDMEQHPKYIQDFYQHELDHGVTANTVIHYHTNIRKCQQPALRQRREPERNPGVAWSQ